MTPRRFCSSLRARELVQRAADLVRAGPLEDLGLQPNVEAGALAEDARGEERRFVDVRRDDRARLLEIRSSERRHRLNRESSSPCAALAPAPGAGAPRSEKDHRMLRRDVEFLAAGLAGDRIVDADHVVAQLGVQRAVALVGARRNPILLACERPSASGSR